MEQLTYEPLDDMHAIRLFTIWGDPEVIRYTNVRFMCTLGEAEARVRMLKQFDVFVVKKDQQVIGIVGCPSIDREKNEYGLFYQFSKEYWGQGIATAAAGWMIDYMKKTYGEVTLFADVLEKNRASEKILRHLGFQKVTEDKNNKQQDEGLHCYRLTK
ncbi:MAG: GNAT family N-acetyltransferase [bacterium]|nr:GNAT family N-acetyltransferase [bacterium]